MVIKEIKDAPIKRIGDSNFSKKISLCRKGCFETNSQKSIASIRVIKNAVCSMCYAGTGQLSSVAHMRLTTEHGNLRTWFWWLNKRRPQIEDALKMAKKEIEDASTIRRITIIYVDVLEYRFVIVKIPQNLVPITVDYRVKFISHILC